MKRYLILLILTIFAGAIVFAQQDLQPAAIVHLTRSEPITVGQLKTEVKNAETQSGRTFTSAERRQVLDLMINNRLAMQAAERERLTITDNELNQEIENLKAQMAQQLGRRPTEAEFSEAIRRETGLDQVAFRTQLRQQGTVQKYLMSKKGDQINNIQQPGDKEIIDFYNLNKREFIRPDTIRFSMILIPFGQDAASKTKARELAERLNREIGLNPNRFDEAVASSHAPNSGYRGGDAGYLPRIPEAQQRVGAEFMNIAFSMKQAEVSRLIEGLGAYQIIKITETYGQKSLELDDIMQLGTRTTVRQAIGANMMQQRQFEALARATQDLAAELRIGRPFQIMENNLNW